MYLSRICFARFHRGSLKYTPLAHTMKQRLYSFHQRLISKRVSTSISQDPNWSMVYKLPVIRGLAILNKLKLLQTSFVVLATPVCSVLYSNGSITLLDFGFVTGLATLACAMLYFVSYFSRRLIGMIYLDKARQAVKISHLTFWGRRRDVEVPVPDIVPLLDGSCKLNDIYVKLHRYSTPEYFLLSVKYGRIFNKDDFEFIMGSLNLNNK